LKTHIVRRLGLGFALASTLFALPASAKWLEHAKTHVKIEIPDDNWKADKQGDMLRVAHEKDPVFVIMDAVSGGPEDAQGTEREVATALKRTLTDIKLTEKGKPVSNGQGLVGYEYMGEGKNKNGVAIQFLAVTLGQPKTSRGVVLLAMGTPAAFRQHQTTLRRMLNSPKS
jgi:hypothetical protein